MPQYRISQQVKDVYGHQYWLVDAESVEEAIELHNKGKSEFEDSDLEVMDLEDIDEDCVELVDDEGGNQ